MAKFIYVGQPKDSMREHIHNEGSPQRRVEMVLNAKAGDGPDVVNRFGVRFVKNGPAMSVSEVGKTGERHNKALMGNAHFKMVGASSQQQGKGK